MKLLVAGSGNIVDIGISEKIAFIFSSGVTWREKFYILLEKLV